MRAIHAWLLTLPMLAIAAAPAALAAEESEFRLIKQRIEQAREQLDKAARKLGELHSQMWQMETTGSRASEPMLGILLADAGSAEGLVLAGVTPEGGAEQAGLKADDRIVVVNGVRMDEGGDRMPLHLLSQAMASVKAGATVPLEFVRDGETMEADVVTQPRAHYMARVMEEKRPWLESLQSLGELEHLEALEGLEELEVLGDGKLDLRGDVMRVPAGLRLEDVAGDLAGYFEIDRGVLVLRTTDSAQPLKPGDILLDLDGEAVTSADAALERMAQLEGRVAAQVKRQGRVRDVELDMDALNAHQAVHVMRGERRIRIQRDADGKQRLEITVDD
jgi:predicted metalloprotease with PDZ domain